MNKLAAYLPQDRRRALARGESLPDRTTGTALFADISGFTLLTERLRDTLGRRRGIEALTSQINAVYTALIAEIERYDGSVIGFAGDAVMCWFDAGRWTTDDGPRTTAARAVACGLALQAAMSHFPELGLKVAIATGPARRFVVGDPQIHYLDTLAGATVGRTATGEHLANKGELLLDEATVKRLGTALTISKWRADSATGESFAVITHLAGAVTLPPPPEIPALAPTQLQAWLHQPVYEREAAGQGSFLTEFRPCVALFVRFVGIDYDSDEATAQLDAFIRQLQQITARYDGALLQLTIGDKGSYAYINFGALQAHEDDGRRAVKAALALREVTPLVLQMGVAQGVMRVGAYGGATRRTYGALGDDVNLAARLMSQAAPGEVLVSKQVQSAIATDFAFVAHPAVQFKGKAEPLPVFAVADRQQRRAIRLQEPAYALPMVGRQAELKQIEEKLDLAAEGKSQVIGIVAEAGLGKSRLVAEVVRAARKKGFAGYGGACQSDAISTPYHVWKTVWQAFFDVDPEMPLRKLMRNLEGEIEDRAPLRVAAMPLLNVLLGSNMPENDFTELLEPKTRQSALHALLEDCLKAAAQDEPLLIVIEDMHWVDALSHDLLEQLAKALAQHPVCFMLAYRSPQIARLEAPRLEALAQFTKIELHELTQTEAESAIRAKLAQLYPARGGSLPERLAETLMARAQGNPFYLEELLNYVHDRGLDPADLDQIKLPDSLHTLILSRIDRLSEQEKSTLRVASIVGRLFRARWLTGYYPELGLVPQVKAALDALESLEITPLESPEPELAYLFKHIVTHEVTYESLPFSTRARLHEQLAAYLENTYPESLPLEALAFHYGRSENTAKQMEYLRKAGEAAQKNFANDAALDFFDRALHLLPDTDREGQYAILLERETVYGRLGNRQAQEADLGRLTELAQTPQQRLDVAGRFSWYLSDVGNYEAAITIAEQSYQWAIDSGDEVNQAQALLNSAWSHMKQANYPIARQQYQQAYEIAQRCGGSVQMARALGGLGGIAHHLAQFDSALDYHKQALQIRQAIQDVGGQVQSLRHLGGIAIRQGGYETGQSYYQQALQLIRQMGDRPNEGRLLANLGSSALLQGQYPEAEQYLQASQSLLLAVDDKATLARVLESFGHLNDHQGHHDQATSYYEQSMTIFQTLGDRSGEGAVLNNLGIMADNRGRYDLSTHYYQGSLAIQREIGERFGEAFVLNNLGLASERQGLYAQSATYLQQSLVIFEEIGHRPGRSAVLANLGDVAFAQKQYDVAIRYYEQGRQIAEESSFLVIVGIILNNLGAVALAKAEFEQAQAYYQKALTLRQELNQPQFWVEDWAGLALTALRMGHHQAAQTYAHELLSAWTDNRLFTGAEHPLRAFHFIWQVCEELGLVEADDVLATAVGLIQIHLDNHPDPTAQAIYLQQPHHQALWSAVKMGRR
ncbi:MAG: tetratricopeptide repeat protein [Chloroflexota bacterium]